MIYDQSILIFFDNLSKFYSSRYCQDLSLFKPTGNTTSFLLVNPINISILRSIKLFPFPRSLKLSICINSILPSVPAILHIFGVKREIKNQKYECHQFLYCTINSQLNPVLLEEAITLFSAGRQCNYASIFLMWIDEKFAVLLNLFSHYE